MGQFGDDVADLPKPSDHLISESIPMRVLEAPDGDGIFHPDGTFDVVIQRPGAGRGPGSRIFEAAHLKSDCDAGTFVGWPCFDNHDSPIARRARAGLPRPPSELTGVVRETYFDPAYTDPELDEKFGFAPGAAIGRIMPTEELEKLVRRIPEAVKTSVNATAKKLSRGQWKGKAGWVVEGYVNDPEDSSIDFVTAAGAGGQVKRVLQTPIDDVRSASGAPYSGSHERDDADGEDEVNLKEALESEEFDRVLEAKVDERIADKGFLTEDEADKRVQEAVSSQSRIRDLRDHARRRVLEAKGLGKTSRDDLLERFGARDTGNGVLEAAASLDVEPEMEGDTVKRTRLQVLDAALDDAFKLERQKVQEAAPTRVDGQGPSGDGGELEDGQVHAADADWVAAAERAGVNVEKAYGIKRPAPAATT